MFLKLLVAAALPAAQPLDGVWRSQGYGYVFEVHGPEWKTFEVTTETCVAGFTAKGAPGPETAFKSNEGDSFLVRLGGTADRKLVHFEGAASDIRIDRLPRMPAVCDHPAANTPLANFEVFTRTWAENYISFDLKHADWTQIVAASRSKITAGATPAELFDVLEAMIAPLGDMHTGIEAPKLKRPFYGKQPRTERLMKGGEGGFEKHGMRRLLAVTERAYLRGPLSKFCNGRIQHGHIDNVTGYLRILAFGAYTEQGGFTAGLSALEAALDTIFSDPKLKSLVIDVRINFGGDDPYGLAIASRLATGDYLAYTKQARADPIDRNKWTPGDPSWIRPSSRPGFRGPVVVLTGPLTISAGETFTQALMGRTPHITRIGENTAGLFSDVLGRKLPNGWTFGLPNEVFRTPEGTAFDVSGIPPDIAVPVFADADVAAGKDPGMAKALEILRAR